jgi:hypothetical protein
VMVRLPIVFIGAPFCDASRFLDLADSGAHHFAETIRKIKQKYAVFRGSYNGFSSSYLELLRPLLKL